MSKQLHRGVSDSSTLLQIISISIVDMADGLEIILMGIRGVILLRHGRNLIRSILLRV